MESGRSDQPPLHVHGLVPHRAADHSNWLSLTENPFMFLSRHPPAGDCPLVVHPDPPEPGIRLLIPAQIPRPPGRPSAARCALKSGRNRHGYPDPGLVAVRPMLAADIRSLLL